MTLKLHGLKHRTLRLLPLCPDPFDLKLHLLVGSPDLFHHQDQLKGFDQQQIDLKQLEFQKSHQLFQLPRRKRVRHEDRSRKFSLIS
jgi:hypothetical protein